MGGMRWITVTVAFIIFFGGSQVDGQTATHANETALRATLLSGYDPKTRPYTPTYIDVVYLLRSVQVLNVAEQTLSHTAFPQLSWHDPRLVWNPADYSNITELDIDWVWRPKFSIGNSVDGLDVHGSDNDESSLVVYSNGSVLWWQMIVPDTACDVNIELFPFDKQTCSVLLVFTQYHEGHAIAYNLSYPEANTGFYIESAEWELTSTAISIVKPQLCCPQYTMSYLSVDISFRRLHTFYINTFLIPTILLSVCLVWPFYVPTESGERLGFTLTVLLSYTVLLSVTTSFLPTTSKQVPNLAVYLLIILFMCTLSVCNVALDVKIYYLETAVPECIKRFHRKAYPIVFFKRRSKNKVGTSTPVLTISNADVEEQPIEKPPISPDNGREETKISTEDAEEITWKQVSELLDRICLMVYGFSVFVIDLILMIFLQVGV